MISEKLRKIKVRSVYRDLRELLWPRRWLLLLGLALILVNRVAGLVLPGTTKFLIDDVVGKRNLALLTPLAAIVGAATLMQAVSSFALTQLLSKSAQRLIADLRMKVQRHIGRLPVRYYDANKTGALVSRIMTDVEGVRNLVGTGLVELLGGLLTAAIAFVLLLNISAKLTLLALVVLVAFGIFLFRAMSYLRPIFRERSVIRAQVTGRLTESLGGVRIVKGFHAEEREASAFADGALRIFDNVRRTLTTMAALSGAASVVLGLVSVTVMITGGRMILRGELTLGEFVAFTLYMGFMVAPVFQVVHFGGEVIEAFAGLDRMHEVLAETPEDVDPQRRQTIGSIHGDVMFEDVHFEYDAGKQVLKGISLHARPGTVTALVGSSGSGKSTLISLVAAFAKPVSGHVLVDGADLASVRLDSYRSQLGVVLQDNFLFDGTVRENVLFGKPDATEEELLRAARIASVDEFAEKLEKSYDTVIGERGVKLSGGQRQRIAIARAILADPRILILDEATSSLDTDSEEFIQRGLASLMRGRTTFVIAHRLSTIRSADQILVIEAGEVVERGTHQQLLARMGRYFDLYTKQAGLEANRFVNPGETEPQPEVEVEAKASDMQAAGDGETAVSFFPRP